MTTHSNTGVGWVGTLHCEARPTRRLGGRVADNVIVGLSRGLATGMTETAVHVTHPDDAEPAPVEAIADAISDASDDAEHTVHHVVDIDHAARIGELTGHVAGLLSRVDNVEAALREHVAHVADTPVEATQDEAESLDEPAAQVVEVPEEVVETVTARRRRAFGKGRR